MKSATILTFAAALMATTSMAWADSDKGGKYRSEREYGESREYRERREYRDEPGNYGQEVSRRAHERNEERKAEKRRGKDYDDDDRRYSRRDRDDDDRRYSRRDSNTVYDRDGRVLGTRQPSGVILDRDGRPIGTGTPSSQTVYDRDGRPVGKLGGAIDPTRAATEAVIGILTK